QREMDRLEASLAFLASVGSVSPYVGLLGTVWGIMHAFRGLANMAQATLAAVAPGIAEALVATAIGLFAAIPAVVAYNRFSHDVDRLAVRFESFMEEFSNILQRQAQARLPGAYDAAGGRIARETEEEPRSAGGDLRGKGRALRGGPQSDGRAAAAEHPASRAAGEARHSMSYAIPADEPGGAAPAALSLLVHGVL